MSVCRIVSIVRVSAAALWLAYGAVGHAAAPLDFAKDILPILEGNCLPCHNATKSEGELNMETPQLMLQGGEHGAAIKLNKGLESLLYRTAAREKKPFMPPADNKSKAKPLTSQQLELLRRWIDEGAIGHGKERQLPKWQPMPAGVTAVSSVAVNDNGTLAVAARGNRVSFYDLLTQQRVFELPADAHRDVVNAIAFSLDGLLLATSSFGEVKLWQPAKIVIKPTLEVPASASSVEARSMDGKLLAFAKEGESAKIASADGKQVIAELRADRAWADRLLAMDRALLAANFELSYQKLELERAEAKLKQFTDEAKKTADEHAAFVKRKAEIEKKVIDAIKIRDVAMKEREIADEEADRETKAKQAAEDALKAATEDKSVIKGDADGLKKALEVAAKKQDEAQKKQKDIVAKFNQAVKELSEAKSEVGKAQDAERTAKKAAEDLAAEKLKVEALKRLVTSAQVARDAADHAQNELKTKLPPVVSAFRGIAFSEDAHILFSSHDDGRVRAWSASDGAPLWTREIDAKPLGALQVKGDTLIIAKVAGAVAMPLEVAWELVRTIGDANSAKSPLTDRVNALAFSPDGKLLATGSGDPTRSGEIKLWDAASGKLVRELVKPHKDAVLALDFSPDGKQLASGSADRAVRIWEVSTGKQLRNLEAHSHHVLAVSYRNDGRVLASAGADAAIRTWLLDTGDVLKTINDFKKEVTGLRYIELRNQLACASGDSELRLLSDEGAKTRSDTTGSKAFLTSFAATVDGKVRIVGDASGCVWMLDAAGKRCAVWQR